MINPGSPFRSGTLSSILLSAALTIVITYYYIEASINHGIFLVLIGISLASTIRQYFLYRKLRLQGGDEFIGDHS